tara:strand:+ start:359 stop:460 length:102 start_codon:yes stop_codon:yes gene_type:complete
MTNSLSNKITPVIASAGCKIAFNNNKRRVKQNV